MINENGTSKAYLDNGRLRMEKYRGVLYCDAYMEDEFSEHDVQSMIDFINQQLGGFTDIILKKTGNYSVSAKAQIRLSKGVKEFRNFVYVADTSIKRESALYAAATYMADYNARVCTSKEEAYTHLVESGLQS